MHARACAVRISIAVTVMLGTINLVAIGSSTAVAASRAETDLDAISCTSPNACTAVGESGPVNAAVLLAERWNGTKWTIQPTPPSPPGSTTVALDGVSCTSHTACTAVGNSESALLAERWNGTKCTIQPTPKPVGATSSSLKGVSCTSPTSCTADGISFLPSGFESPLAERWNGTKWTIQPTPNPSGSTQTDLVAISCTSPNACSAVGNTSHGYGAGPAPLAERWNGTKWTIQSTPNPSGSTLTLLLGVSCTLRNACAAVGHSYNGTITSLAERWNGTKWRIQTLTTTTTTTPPATTTTTAVPPVSQITIASLDAAVATQSGTSSAITATCGPASVSFAVGTDILCSLFDPSVGGSEEVIQITGSSPSSFTVLVGPGSSIPCRILNAAEQAAFTADGQSCSVNG